MLVLVWPSEEDEEDAPFTEIKPSLPGFAFQWIPVARYVCAVGVVPRDWEAPLPRLNIKPPEKGMLWGSWQYDWNRRYIYDSCVLFDSYDWTFASQQWKPSSNYKTERKPERKPASPVMSFLFSASPALGTCRIMSKLRRLMMPWAMRSFCTAWSRSVHFGRPGDQVISTKDFAESLQTWEKFGDSDAVSPHTLDTVHCHEATALALILISLDISLIFYLSLCLSLSISVYLTLSRFSKKSEQIWTAKKIEQRITAPWRRQPRSCKFSEIPMRFDLRQPSENHKKSISKSI